MQGLGQKTLSSLRRGSPCSDPQTSPAPASPARPPPRRREPRSQGCSACLAGSQLRIQPREKPVARFPETSPSRNPSSPAELAGQVRRPRAPPRPPPERVPRQPSGRAERTHQRQENPGPGHGCGAIAEVKAPFQLAPGRVTHPVRSAPRLAPPRAPAGREECAPPGPPRGLTHCYSRDAFLFFQQRV